MGPARLAGGSSGGAAVAVAAGLVPVRAGQRRRRLDPHPGRASTGCSGSSRRRGRISNAPLGSEVTGLGTHGPLARTVRDAAAMLDAMAGPVLGDPSWAPPLPPGETFLGAADRPPGRLRVGRYRVADARRRARAGGRRGLRRRRAAARRPRARRRGRAGGPARPRGAPAFERVWALSGTTLPVPAARFGELRPLTRELRARGLALSARDAMEALSTLRLFARRFLQATAGYDVLLAPVTTMTPRPVGWFDADGDGAADFERQKRYAAFPALSNVTGSPRSACPCTGPPAGCRWARMLVGRPADEATLISCRRSWRRPGPGRTDTRRLGSGRADAGAVPVSCAP